MSDVVYGAALEALQPPPDYTVSQWADIHVILAPELASEAGRWRTDRAPYQREMMDVMTDPAVHTIVEMTSAQVGKTSTLLNGIGYHVHHAPCPMLLIQPTLDMAQAFSQDKLAPMINASPALFDRVADEKSRSSSNTIFYKAFPGGYLAIAGANSPTSLRMRSVRIVLADEIDAYPISIGEEGDPLKLAHKRTQTFFDAKLIVSSTPKVAGTSRIAAMYEESDQRKYYIPCPDCGHYQHLVWENVHWTKGQPDTAGYACEECGTLWADGDIKRALRHGEWRATQPFNGTAGFYIWQIYSPWSSLEEIVREYEASEGKPAERQVWVNTVLGLPWDGDERAGVTAEMLYQRREIYPAAKVPERACVLTAGVDVQGDRLECLIRAFGADNESWCLEHVKIYGDPSTDPPWAELEEVLRVRLPHPSGKELGIEATAIDSGYLTQRVYDFSSRHIQVGRRWYAIKGQPGEGRVAWEMSKVKLKGGNRLYLVGVDGLKTEIYSRLGVLVPGPNFIHFPEHEPFNEDWFHQLTVERIRTVYDPRGFPRREFYKPEGQRNEAFDLMVYTEAAHKSLNVDHKARLAHLYQRTKKTDMRELAQMFR